MPNVELSWRLKKDLKEYGYKKALVYLNDDLLAMDDDGYEFDYCFLVNKKTDDTELDMHLIVRDNDSIVINFFFSEEDAECGYYKDLSIQHVVRKGNMISV